MSQVWEGGNEHELEILDDSLICPANLMTGMRTISRSMTSRKTREPCDHDVACLVYSRECGNGGRVGYSLCQQLAMIYHAIRVGRTAFQCEQVSSLVGVLGLDFDAGAFCPIVE